MLTNKQYKTYERLSRYQGLPIYFNTETEKYDTQTISWLSNETNYQLYKIQYDDDLDILATRFYNNPTYYWIIASFNHISDPFKPLVEGAYIKIPVLSLIEFEV